MLPGLRSKSGLGGAPAITGCGETDGPGAIGGGDNLGRMEPTWEGSGFLRRFVPRKIVMESGIEFLTTVLLLWGVTATSPSP